MIIVEISSLAKLSEITVNRILHNRWKIRKNVCLLVPTSADAWTETNQNKNYGDIWSKCVYHKTCC